jgi:hypothetical protein
MLGLMIITLGIYGIYWLVTTKTELNNAGAQIPTSWLLIIPFANLYFLYTFAQAFSDLILKNKEEFTIVYFLLLICAIPLGEFVYQAHMNSINHYAA